MHSGGVGVVSSVVLSRTSAAGSITRLVVVASPIPENASTGAVVAILSVTGDAFVAPAVYSIAPGGDPSGFFEVIGNELRVRAGAALDYETATSHGVNLQVTDAAPNTYSKSTTVFVTNVNEAPTAIALSSSTVPENASTGLVIGTLTSTDEDAGGSFTYLLTADASGFFEIVGDELRVKAGAALDFETATSHDITVQTQDAGGLTFSDTLTINVTDLNEAPTGMTFTGSLDVPDAAVDGTTIITLSTADPDAGDTHTYTQITASNDFETTSAGVVRVKTGAALAIGTYGLTIRTMDSAGLTFDDVFTVNVIDADTEFTPSVTPENLVVAVNAGFNETLAGDEIVTWGDFSGNGNHLIGATAGSGRPVASTDGAGKPVVRFLYDQVTPKNGYLQIPTSMSGMSLKDFSVYIVGSNLQQGFTQGFFGFTGPSTTIFRQVSANTVPFHMRGSTRNALTLQPPGNAIIMHMASRSADARLGWNNTSQTVSAMIASTGLAGGTINSNNAGTNEFCYGDRRAIYIYDVGHTDAEANTIIAELAAQFNITMSYDKKAVIGCDSFAAGKIVTDNQSWIHQAFNDGTLSDWQFYNFGVPAQTIGVDLTSGYSQRFAVTKDALFAGGLSRNVCLMLGGTNDIGSDHITGAQTFARLTDFFTIRQAVGWECIPITLSDRSGSNGDEVTAFNILVRAGHTSIDSIIDAGSGGDGVLGRLDDYTDSAFFDGDGLHPNNGGHTAIAENVETDL